MNLTMEEYQRLSDEKSQQSLKVAELQRLLAVKTLENAKLMEEAQLLKMEFAATRLENMLLKNYITLSAEKIKVFVSHLNGIDRFAFLKTFLEYVLPQEHYQEQLLLVNEVMTMPDETKQVGGTIINGDYVGGDKVKEKTIIPDVGNFKPQIQTQTMNVPFPPLEQDGQNLLEDE